MGAMQSALPDTNVGLRSAKTGPLLQLPNRLESGQNRLTVVEWWVTMAHPVARVRTAGVA